MVEFLNKDKAYAELVDIVNKAESQLVLLSPYIKIPDYLLERLKFKAQQGIKIIVVCREKDLKTEVRSQLKQIKNLELRFDEVLHAKCFYNDKSMVITSLNSHEHSQQHNREMGILLDSKEDSSVFKEALNEAKFIVSSAREDSRTKTSNKTKTSSKTKQNGTA